MNSICDRTIMMMMMIVDSNWNGIVDWPLEREVVHGEHHPKEQGPFGLFSFFWNEKKNGQILVEGPRNSEESMALSREMIKLKYG